MSIIAVLLALLFVSIVTLVVKVSIKMWKKADLIDKSADLRLVNEMAEDVEDLNKELNPSEIKNKRKQIKKFNKT